MKRSGSLALALALAVVGSLVLGACGSSGGSGGTGDATVSIVGYSVAEAANKATAEQFNKTPEGKGVKFTTSYGASGDQSRAVESGLDAQHGELGAVGAERGDQYVATMPVLACGAGQVPLQITGEDQFRECIPGSHGQCEPMLT